MPNNEECNCIHFHSIFEGNPKGHSTGCAKWGTNEMNTCLIRGIEMEDEEPETRYGSLMEGGGNMSDGGFAYFDDDEEEE